MDSASRPCPFGIRLALVSLATIGIASCEVTPAREPLVPRIRLAAEATRLDGRQEAAVATIAGTTRYVMGRQQAVYLQIRNDRSSLRTDAAGVMSVTVTCPPQAARPHRVTFDLVTLDLEADFPRRRAVRRVGSLCRGGVGAGRTVRFDGLRPDSPFTVTANLAAEPPPRVSAPFVVVPEGGELRFALGILAEGVIVPKPIDVVVTAHAPDGRTRQVGHRTVPPGDTVAPGRWQPWRLPLDEARAALGPRLSFALEAVSRTEHTGMAHLFWGDPTVWGPRETPRPEAQRNVILVSLDTLRADRLGFAGYPLDVTPNLDRFAREGSMFTDAVSSANWTKPAHATMLTGTDPCVHRIGVRGRAAGDAALPAGVVPLAEHLRRVGYETAAFTEDAHVSEDSFQRGFGVFRVHTGGEKMNPLGAVEETVDGASAWMTDHVGVAFFLFVHTYQVHAPYDPPLRYKDVAPADALPPLAGLPSPARDAMADAAAYVGEVAFTDEILGRLLTRVDALGLRERTIVVVTSDHGEAFGEHGVYRHGIGLHREQIRVPLVFRAPGLVAAGRRIGELVGLVDVTPTLLDLLDLPRPAWMQGVSLAGALAPVGAVRPPPGRTLSIRGLGEEGARTTTGKMKFSRSPARWDLITDPGELHPRPASREEAARVRRILDASCKRARRLIAQTGPRAGAPGAGTLSIDEQLRLRALGYLE